MIRAILFLFLCLLPLKAQTIREQTQKNLRSMTNITSKQIVNGKPYRVAMFGGRQVFNREIPMPHIGLRPGTEWYSMLQNTILWKLVPKDDYFTYSDGCRWFEITRRTLASDSKWEGWVPCEGEIYVDGTNIMRITQRLTPDRLVTTVAIDMEYGWVQLRDKRLLPVRMTMTAKFKNGKTHRVDVEWTEYKEFGAEVIVKDISPEETRPPAVQFGTNFFTPVDSDEDSVQANTAAKQVTPVQTSPAEKSGTPALTSVDRSRGETTESVKTWKRLIGRLLK